MSLGVLAANSYVWSGKKTVDRNTVYSYETVILGKSDPLKEFMGVVFFLYVIARRQIRESLWKAVKIFLAES